MNKNKVSQKRRSKKPDYIIAVAINLILLYVANNLLRWEVPYLTRSFNVPLLILNISIIATIIVNLAFLAYDPAWFVSLARAFLNLISAVFLYTFLVVFPLNIFAESGVFWVRVVLIVGTVAVSIAVIVEFINFLRNLTRS